MKNLNRHEAPLRYFHRRLVSNCEGYCALCLNRYKGTRVLYCDVFFVQLCSGIGYLPSLGKTFSQPNCKCHNKK